MAKRRKSTNNDLAALIALFAFILQALIVLVVRLIIFTYDVITFYTSSYRQKSGNGFFKTYFNKGNYGEFILYRKVIRIFGKKSVLANIYLESKNTETTEIDILAVSTKGIYIFEMKNYAGYIYGSDTDQYWTQAFNRRSKHQFYNPLRQNYAHTKAVENYLQLKSGVTIPIVVFSNRSKLSKININQNQRVYQYRNAIKFIKKYEKTNPSLISLDDKENYLVKLIEKCNMTEEVKAKHIQGIKELLANKS
jgi:hypothetical protein